MHCATTLYAWNDQGIRPSSTWHLHEICEARACRGRQGWHGAAWIRLNGVARKHSLMFEAILDQIKNIFVGRTAELARLQVYWKMSQESGEHMVYVLLNAPGIGKTALMKCFGHDLEQKREGLFIEFPCTSDYDSPARLNLDLVKTIQAAIHGKKNVVEYFINKDPSSREKERQFSRLDRSIEMLRDQPVITLNDVMDLLKDLSSIIPLFLVADEIQEFQKLSFNTSTKSQDETGLHYFARLLKNFLRSKMLLLLSGTRYHVLNQVGGAIGSPIRGKVVPLIMSRLDIGDVKSYVTAMKNIIVKEVPETARLSLASLMNNYETFLLGFSGGHPRTIATLTTILLERLQLLLDNEKYTEYTTFLDFLFPIAIDVIPGMLLGTDHVDAMNEMANHVQFSTVKKWIIDHGFDGQFLGSKPAVINDPSANAGISEIVYQLMNVGVILQNGNDNYYLSSYFHFLDFLNQVTGEHEAFLRQVLTNKFFTWSCGRHSGFGYTFETIFASVLLSRVIKTHPEVSMPLDSQRLRTIRVIPGQPNWTKFPIEPDILYQFPDAKGVDMFVLQGTTLLSIQLTTAADPPPAKIVDLSRKMDEIARELNIEKRGWQCRGWFVSLYPFASNIPLSKNISISAGERLAEILGPELFQRLLQAKALLSV
jgi:hypothetical protein